MKYNLISEDDFYKCFPNIKANQSYINLYSCYRFYLERYLSKVLFLEDVNNQIKNGNLGVNLDSLYKKISNLKFEYVFLVNNILFSKLSQDELIKFQELVSMNDEVNIENFVVNTFKELLDYNGSIVIGVSAKSDSRLQDYLREKSNYYMQTLNVPVSIRNLSDELEKNQLEILKQYPKYLPLGSIVILKEGTKKIMIMGYATIDLEKRDKIYDYIGCLYPEGVFDTRSNLVFNHEDIRSLLALGFSDQEHKDFLNNMIDTLGDRTHQQDILNELS